MGPRKSSATGKVTHSTCEKQPVLPHLRRPRVQPTLSPPRRISTSVNGLSRIESITILSGEKVFSKEMVSSLDSSA
jgi:hypothetical protein